ncbi:MAG: hypothetical protein K2N23_05530 [Clostridia bacterium]|nr:hypothetical protein [Clostridia bacterium]
MKKALILLAVFCVLDIILYAVAANLRGSDVLYIFLPAIFLEIAIYGSFIIYEISKLKDKIDDKKDEKKDE